MSSESTPFAEAVARVAREPAVVSTEASLLVEQMTDDERLDLMQGDVDFWPGMADLMSGGYHDHTFTGAACPRLGVPGLSFSDGPRGVVVGQATCFPVTMARGATWDSHLEQRIGEAIGLELRAVGANLYGGVCVNLLAHPAWGRAQETYGEDPVLLGTLGGALTRGVQRHVMACVKHFAANSIENARFQVDVTVSDDALHDVYLPHFRRIVEAGAMVVMSAYNSVNGHWCGENRPLLTEILREQWGFDGIVISDWIYGLRHAGRSVAAGLDVEMPYRMVRHRQLRDHMAAGVVSAAEVTATCERIVAVQLRHAVAHPHEAVDPSVVAGPEHRALAREAAARSMVLLRNEGELIPVHPDEVRSIAVVGALAARANLGDHGSSRVHPPHVVTLLDGLRDASEAAGVSVTFHDGAHPGEAAEVASGADIAIVVVGLTHLDEGEYIGLGGTSELQALHPPRTPADDELLGAALARAHRSSRTFGTGGDRTTLRLPSDQEHLIEAVAARQPRTVVVVTAGSAIDVTPWHHQVASLLLAWYPGMEGGNALADVVFGRHAPTGRLPFTMVADPAHLPPFDPQATAVTYDRWVGYRRLARDGHRAAYPFGFGLTTTTFGWSDARVVLSPDRSSLVATVTITNTGPRAADDCVQMYAGHQSPTMDVEPWQLVGFARSGLLEPGASTTVTVTAALMALSHWDVDEQVHRLEPGRYRVRLGRHSADPNALHVTLALPAGRLR
jgi:beta-glucosidase